MNRGIEMFVKRIATSVKENATLALIALLLLGGLLITLLSARTAVAADRITRGEVESYFQAWNNGRIAVSTAGAGHSGQFQEPLSDAAILPIFSPMLTDLRYCVEDYHLIMLAWFGASHEGVSNFADSLEQTFIVDGQVLATERTPVARRIPSGFGFNEGAILAPDDLDVGPHTLEWQAIMPTGSLTDSFTFYIDAPGTGACQ